jgi:signal transduction histidine kinase
MTAEQEMLRLNELVKELVDFSNPKKYQLEQKRMSDLIKRVIRLVENDLTKHGITFSQEFENDLPSVLVNENEIVEMLLNLIINAIEAMPHGGRLSIKAFSKLDQNQQKPFVTLTITDSGEGIAPEVQHKVFDRYFTTKDSGTGLGLSICERIVMAHNGDIKFESEQGVSTTFIIKLPAA